MKILALSDLHRSASKAAEVLAESASADVVVGAGDFATMGLGLEDTISLLRGIKVPFILVPGNHDNLDALRASCSAIPSMHVLHGEALDVGGLAFFGLGYGSGVTDPEPWNRALNEAEATRLLLACPAEAIIVSHSPPFGAVDAQEDGRHDGSKSLREAILIRRPKIVLCGHIHHAWGRSEYIGETCAHNLGPHPTWFTI